VLSTAQSWVVPHVGEILVAGGPLARLGIVGVGDPQVLDRLLAMVGQRLVTRELVLLMAACAEARLVVGFDQGVTRLVGGVGVDAKGRDAEGSADRSPLAGSAGMNLFDVVEVQQDMRHGIPRKVMWLEGRERVKLIAVTKPPPWIERTIV
jgi:hypothetical protein